MQIQQGDGDIIYGQPSKASVSDKIEFVQRDARFAIILAIKGTLRVKPYTELRLEEKTPEDVCGVFDTDKIDQPQISVISQPSIIIQARSAWRTSSLKNRTFAFNEFFSFFMNFVYEINLISTFTVPPYSQVLSIPFLKKF